jgi:hypothetical protein
MAYGMLACIVSVPTPVLHASIPNHCQPIDADIPMRSAWVEPGVAWFVGSGESLSSCGPSVNVRGVKRGCVVWYQADVCAACGIAENDASRVLKPYQLVGVNFMLLLHRKNVGGGICASHGSPVVWAKLSICVDCVHGF